MLGRSWFLSFAWLLHLLLGGELMVLREALVSLLLQLIEDVKQVEPVLVLQGQSGRLLFKDVLVGLHAHGWDHAHSH